MTTNIGKTMDENRIKDVAVVILNYLSWEESLKEATLVHDLYGLSWEQFIIVDNASPNESDAELSKKEIGNYHYLRSDSNSGYAKGNNIGIKLAEQLGYRYVWILNNDILMDDRDLLGHMLSIFEKDSQIAVINPDVCDLNGRAYNRDACRYSFYDMTLGILQYKRKGRTIIDLGGYSYVYRPQGCCMLLDVKKTSKCGYLDENTFLYCEEMILAERFRKKGYKCACDIAHKVIHNHSKTTQKVFERKKLLKIHLRSYSYYLREYRGYGFIRLSICCFFYAIKFYAIN